MLVFALNVKKFIKKVHVVVCVDVTHCKLNKINLYVSILSLPSDKFCMFWTAEFTEFAM